MEGYNIVIRVTPTIFVRFLEPSVLETGSCVMEVNIHFPERRVLKTLKMIDNYQNNDSLLSFRVFLSHSTQVLG
jgi:hypothetical protein